QGQQLSTSCAGCGGPGPAAPAPTHRLRGDRGRPHHPHPPPRPPRQRPRPRERRTRRRCGRPRQVRSSSFAVVSLPEAPASGAVPVLDGLPPPASPVAVLGPPLTARSAPTPSVDVPPGLAGPGGLGGVCFGVGLRVGLSVRS